MKGKLIALSRFFWNSNYYWGAIVLAGVFVALLTFRISDPQQQKSLLAALKDTLIPTILVIGGISFLLLSIAGQLAGRIAVSPERQRGAAVIGGGLLMIGVALHVASQVNRPSTLPTMPKGRSVDLVPELFQVDVHLNQSGNDACDSQGMICVSMLRHPLIDVNRKFFGYSTPPCTATVIRESRCLEPFQTDYAVKGVILRRSPEADEGAQEPSPGVDFFCLSAEQGKQGIFQFANCVKP